MKVAENEEKTKQKTNKQEHCLKSPEVALSFPRLLLVTQCYKGSTLPN